MADGQPPVPEPRVGPNAVIQLAVVLREWLGEAEARRVFGSAGAAEWLDAPPADMVPERPVAALFAALARELPAETAMRVAREAGLRTGDYILENRIPRLARMALRAMPARLGAAALLRAIAKHAWTFAGSGAFSFRPGKPAVVEIADNKLLTPDCAWHQGVFTRLFRALVAPAATVRHTACCAEGAPACRFEIWPAPPAWDGAADKRSPRDEL